MKARKQLTVEELMSTAVISVPETSTIGMAELDMKLASIRHLPVVDARHRVVGIISNRDLIRAMGQGRPQMCVADVMTRAVRTVRASTPAAHAADMMIEGKFGSLPVVGDEGQLIGIVTETDFLMVARDALRGAVLQRNVA